MPRKTLIRSTTLPYHVNARANNRDCFYSTPEKTWKILADQCFEISILFGAQIHALTLMPNHFHLLLTTPDADIGKVMEHFMRSVTKSLNLISGRSGRVFGAPYHWTLVDSPIYFSHVLKYVYRNPVKARICENTEHYRFSTLSGLLGERHLPFPIHYPYQQSSYLRIPSETDEFLAWLNRPFRKEHEEAVRKALKRTQFSPPKKGWKRTLEALNTDLL